MGDWSQFVSLKRGHIITKMHSIKPKQNYEAFKNKRLKRFFSVNKIKKICFHIDKQFIFVKALFFKIKNKKIAIKQNLLNVFYNKQSLFKNCPFTLHHVNKEISHFTLSFSLFLQRKKGANQLKTAVRFPHFIRI